MYRLPISSPSNLLSARSDRMLPQRRRNRVIRATTSFCALVLCGIGGVESSAAQSLRGSRASVDLQNRVARQHDYTYLDTPDRVRFFADQGWLVRIEPDADFDLHAVSFPYARPEVEVFIRRLGSQYRRACDEQLVVTSLTRPTTRQPRNASSRSVHPTGMAIDLRYSWDQNCRRWLEGVLLSLERQGVLEATLERSPRHYHIALFPSHYAGYVDVLVARQAEAAAETERVAEATAEAASGVTAGARADAAGSAIAEASSEGSSEVATEASSGPTAEAPSDAPSEVTGGAAGAAREVLEYRVQRGDSLWRIARSHGITVDELRNVNGIQDNQIFAGQLIDVPLGN